MVCKILLKMKVKWSFKFSAVAATVLLPKID